MGPEMILVLDGESSDCLLNTFVTLSRGSITFKLSTRTY